MREIRKGGSRKRRGCRVLGNWRKGDLVGILWGYLGRWLDGTIRDVEAIKCLLGYAAEGREELPV